MYKQSTRNILPFVIILFDLLEMICHEMSVMACLPSKLVYFNVLFNTEGIWPALFLSSDNLTK